ncbi:MAG: 1-deoxy-D-xylulose-5-phosphate reductoisomerase [Rickettsiales bacterium]
MKTQTKMETEAAQRSLTILGSTGTIGCNTLKLVEMHPERFRINTLTACNNVDELAKQAITFNAKRAVIANESHYAELKKALSGSSVEALAGDDAIIQAAGEENDLVMAAIVGAAGLKPTLAAIKNGSTIALANKESLACAGSLVMKEAAKHNARILPVDSEHNAIFQLFDAHHPEWINKITITASGGPFREWSLAEMENITPEQAVKHPNWNMGAKISVDSATMMNKGLELIEAFHLFPLESTQFDVIVHPESVVHCLIHMNDGSVLSQMSCPDMCTPITNAMAWPERIEAPVKPLSLAEIGSLNFEAPDETRFPALRLARSALEAGGSAPTVLNAANEIAVNRFLTKQCHFLDITTIVEKTLEQMGNTPIGTIDDVLACDARAREIAEKI